MTEQITALKEQADKLGIKYSPNIGAATLQARISNLSEAIEQHTSEPVAVAPAYAPDAPLVENDQQRAVRRKKEALTLQRVRVICLDPAYKDRGGTTVQASNNLVGTIGKFIEFNQIWHMPTILLNVMREKRYQGWVAGKSEFGVVKKTSKLTPAYAIEVLPSLTMAEYTELQKNQTYANNMRD